MEEEKLAILNICTLLGKLDISPDVSKDLLTSLLIPSPSTPNHTKNAKNAKYALVFTNNITDEESAIGDNCMLVDNFHLLPTETKNQSFISITEEQHNRLLPFTNGQKRVYIKALLGETTPNFDPIEVSIDIQSNRNAKLSVQTELVRILCDLLGIKESNIIKPQVRVLLKTDCKGPIVANEDIYYLFSITKQHELGLMNMIFDSPAFGKLLTISESEHKSLSSFTPQTHYYRVFLPDSFTGLNAKYEHLDHLAKELTKKFTRLSVRGPFCNEKLVFILVSCDDFLCKTMKSFVSLENRMCVEIRKDDYEFSSTTNPTTPKLRTQDKYYLMVSFQKIEAHIQLIHIGNYIPQLCKTFQAANIQIKHSPPSLYYPDNHFMLISVDKRFKDALFAEIISYKNRRATEITKEQFDKGEVPDVIISPNPKKANFKIRVSAKDFRDHEQLTKLQELKKFLQSLMRTPDKIEGPMKENGENILVISNESFWWAPYFFTDVFKTDSRFRAKLIL